jgi:hypothetical protein
MSGSESAKSRPGTPAGDRATTERQSAAPEPSDRVCYTCGTVLIEYEGTTIVENRIKNDRCPACGAHIPALPPQG